MLLGMSEKASQILGMLKSVVGGFKMNANMNKIEILTQNYSKHLYIIFHHRILKSLKTNEFALTALLWGR